MCYKRCLLDGAGLKNLEMKEKSFLAVSVWESCSDEALPSTLPALFCQTETLYGHNTTLKL